MDVLTGILLDVSGSMKASIGDRKVEGTASNWAKSIFKFIDRLIKYDASSGHRGFAIGFGSSCKHVIFDILTTLKRLDMDETLYHSKRHMLAEMMTIIETNGAPGIRQWVTVDEIDEQIDEHQTTVLLNALKNRSEFKQQFIYELLPESCRKVQRNLSKRDMLTEAMTIVENDGAPRVRKWATVDEIDAQIDERKTAALFDGLKNHPEFRRQFIDQCLPDKCKQFINEDDSRTLIGGFQKAAAAVVLSGPLAPIILVGATTVGVFWGLRRFGAEIANGTVGRIPKVHERMTEDSIKDVIKKGMDLAVEKGIYIPVKDIIDRAIDLVGNYILAEVENEEAVYSAKEASEILHGCVGEQELTDDRTNELFEKVKPYIYGGCTPLMMSLNQAASLFRGNSGSQYKLLFVLSDGQPTDGDNPKDSVLSELKENENLGVKVICCYVTRRPIREPRRLYSIMQEEWEDPAKFMFNMSSAISTQRIPRTLFVKKGWKIDIDNNETRMFFQINHPDIIDEVCDLAKQCVCSQDSLADVLSSVSLDIYINKANKDFPPSRQIGKTCYAVASATVIHLSVMRIVGREGGYPGFYKIRDELISMYGVEGAKVGEVLRDTCPRYRLQCKMTDESGAMRAIVEKRPVVAIFQLSDAEWKSFNTYYQRRPNARGILTKDHVNIDMRPQGAALRGHAVVLTSFNSESLRLMNSKGSDFADGGFFKVQNAAVLGMKFYDVFWTEEDLLPSEKEAYRRDGAIISAILIDKLTSLQTAMYRCPLCSIESYVSEFRGHLLAAVCPTCGGTFNANVAQSDLALNIYLTSLLSRDAEAE